MTVCEYLGAEEQGRTKVHRWRCRCECGAVTIVLSAWLRSGNTRSCGCARSSPIGTPRAPASAVSLSHKSERRKWAVMWYRCVNPKSERYARYGGRGIRVADRWKSFDAFLEDMGPLPSSKHEIDRIDNDGNYEPGNCRWVTKLEQQSHTSRSIQLTFRDETFCLSEWARRVGLSCSAVYQRIITRGWSVEKALTTPTRRTKRRR